MSIPRDRNTEMNAYLKRETAYEEALFRLEEKRPAADVIRWLRRVYRSIHDVEAYS